MIRWSSSHFILDFFIVGEWIDWWSFSFSTFTIFDYVSLLFYRSRTWVTHPPRSSGRPKSVGTAHQRRRLLAHLKVIRVYIPFEFRLQPMPGLIHSWKTYCFIQLIRCLLSAVFERFAFSICMSETEVISSLIEEFSTIALDGVADRLPTNIGVERSPERNFLFPNFLMTDSLQCTELFTASPFFQIVCRRQLYNVWAMRKSYISVFSSNHQPLKNAIDD